MMEFDEKTHTYTEKGKILISVTQLMKKHGLAPDYGSVPEAVLQAKAERGTLIHKEIESLIKDGEVGFTEECSQFKKWMEGSKARIIASEQSAHNDIVAGTYDLMIDYGDGCETIADIKTTYTLHTDAVSWQLSIYAYLTGDGSVRKGQAFHFAKDGSLKIVDIPLKPMAEVERLMDCERRGETYTPNLPIEPSQIAAIEEAERIIEQADAMMKEAKKRMAEINEAIIKAMEGNGIKTFESGNVRISYIAPSTRETIDSARLKKEMPSVAKEFTKTTETKASLRITLKGEKE